MPHAALTVAEVFRRYGDAFRAEVGAALSTAQRRVMTAIEQCRTAALGGHVEQCDRCGHRRVWYNSCRNRHCPTCQSLARAAWLARRRADLLPTEYFHVVFTVPPAVAEVATQNKAVVYGLLFRTVAETLRTIAADPRHLGAEIGFFAVLHTWGQTLVHHPHLHCVIPGGGLASDGSGWVGCRPGFFLPVRVLSRYFRRVLLQALQDAFESGQLRFAGRLQPLNDPRRFAEHLRPARETEWVVYAKRPFAGPEQVLDYLGRYTHRVAIADQRLCSLQDGSVRFRYTDYRRAGASRQKTMTLTATEFIRRMLLHVLPPGFHRIRYYGFLANRARRQKLAECRRLLHAPPLPSAEEDAGPATPDYRDRYEALTRRAAWRLPVARTAADRPWYAHGALLGLDLATANLRLSQVVTTTPPVRQYSNLPRSFLTLTATREREMSHEDPDLSTGFGFFTYFVTQAWRGHADNDPCEGRITADEVIEYVRANVRRYARDRQLSQTPTARGDYDPAMLLGVGMACLGTADPESPALLGTAIVEANMNDVDLYIDGELVGTVSRDRPLTIPRLSSGLHDFMGVREGYEPDTGSTRWPWS